MIRHRNPPPASVLDAFNLTDSQTPIPLAGGQGDTFIARCKSTDSIISSSQPTADINAGAVVLKPTANPEETEFMCHIQSQLIKINNPNYRIAEPLPVPHASTNATPDTATPTRSQYVSSTSWTATKFLAGTPANYIRLSEILPASRALHADLATLLPRGQIPDVIRRRSDRWAWADRIAWEEVSIPTPITEANVQVSLAKTIYADIPGFDISPTVHARIAHWLERLYAVRLPLESSEDGQVLEGCWRRQLVHGDMSGNFMFGEPLPPSISTSTSTSASMSEDSPRMDMPPAIIDFSPYWRPVPYAEAIVLADDLTWNRAGREKVEMVGLDWFRVQMLVRAVIFRLVTYCSQAFVEFVEQNLPRLDGEWAVRLVEELVEKVRR